MKNQVKIIIFVQVFVVSSLYATDISALLARLGVLKAKLSQLSFVLKAPGIKKSENTDFVVERLGAGLKGLKITANIEPSHDIYSKISEDIRINLTEVNNDVYTKIFKDAIVSYHPLNMLRAEYQNCVFDPRKPFGAISRRFFERKVVKDVKTHLMRKKEDLTYVSFGSGTLFEDFAIIDQLARVGYFPKKIIFIDSEYEYDESKKMVLNEVSLAEKLREIPSDSRTKGQKRCIAQFMMWFKAFMPALHKFEVIIYSKWFDYQKDLEKKQDLKADIFVFADVHFWADGMPTSSEELQDYYAYIFRDSYPFNKDVLKKIEHMTGRAYALGDPVRPIEKKEAVGPDYGIVIASPASDECDFYNLFDPIGFFDSDRQALRKPLPETPEKRNITTLLIN